MREEERTGARKRNTSDKNRADSAEKSARIGVYFKCSRGRRTCPVGEPRAPPTRPNFVILGNIVFPFALTRFRSPRAMETFSLQRLLNPRSIAVVGASDRPESRGFFVWQSISKSRNGRTVWPVNPKYRYIGNDPCHARVDDLPGAPDLAVVTLRSALIPDTLEALARKGTLGVVVAPEEEHLFVEGALSRRMLDIVHRTGLRVIGPDSIGLMCPPSGLNASYWPDTPRTGGIALVTQSALIATALLDDLADVRTGFSGVVNTGADIDLSISDWIEHFADDARTRVLALQIEGLRRPRAFYSALSYAASRKPVVILHSSSNAGFSGDRLSCHRFGTHAGRGLVFDALVRRAGAQCVSDFRQFASAVVALASCPVPFLRGDAEEGSRVAVLSNGTGFALMAAEAAERHGMHLSGLANSTIHELQRTFPSPQLPVNPVVVGAASSAERLSKTLDIVLKDPSVEGALVTVAPGPSTPVDPTFRLLAHTARTTTKPVILSWASERISHAVRVQLAHAPEARIAAVRSPTAAVGAMAALFREARLKHDKRRIPLRQTPRLAEEALARVRAVLRAPLDAERIVLSGEETRRLCEAADLGTTPERPDSTRPILKLELNRDDVLGTYVRTSLGGDFGKICTDEVAALPPLALDEALRCVRSTRIGGALSDEEALGAARALARLAELGERIPALVEITLEHAANTAPEAFFCPRVRICKAALEASAESPHLTVCPPPVEYETPAGGTPEETYRLRTLVENDFPAMKDFVASLSDQSFFLRFHNSARLSDERVAALCRLDYERETAVLVEAIDRTNENARRIAAVGRWGRTKAPGDAEFGIVVHDRDQRRGLARLVMGELEARAARAGISTLTGYVLRGNNAMDGLMRALGYASHTSAGEDTVTWVKSIGPRP